MNQSPSITELAKALVAVQAELTPIRKDKTAKTEKFIYGYVALDSVMPMALGLLNKHGLALVQTVGNGAHDGGSTLTTMLLHQSGEYISDTAPLLLSRLDSQGQGSAITYARRYGLMAIIGMVADDDDDGAAASRRPPPAFVERDPRPPAQQYAEDRADRLPVETGEAASPAQKKYIHTLASKEFASNTVALEAIVKQHCPEAWRDDDVHTTGLTKAKASALINALVEYTKGPAQ